MLNKPWGMLNVTRVIFAERVFTLGLVYIDAFATEDMSGHNTIFKTF